MNAKHAFILGIAVIFLLGVGIAYGITQLSVTDTPQSPPTIVQAESQTTPAQPTQKRTIPAPDFTLETLDGQSITLSSYEGEKPVILDLFATWCHNCQRAMPELSKLYAEYKDDVEIIGVNIRENKTTVETFITNYGVTYPIVLDPTGSVSEQYGIRYTNTHIMIDSDGNVTEIIPGDLERQDIEALLQAS